MQQQQFVIVANVAPDEGQMAGAPQQQHDCAAVTAEKATVSSSRIASEQRSSSADKLSEVGMTGMLAVMHRRNSFLLAAAIEADPMQTRCRPRCSSIIARLWKHACCCWRASETWCAAFGHRLFSPAAEPQSRLLRGVQLTRPHYLLPARQPDGTLAPSMSQQLQQQTQQRAGQHKYNV